jgi:hypothetical protein
MKRTITAILLAVALLASFAACAGNPVKNEAVTGAIDASQAQVFLTVTLPDGTQTPRQELLSAKSSTLGEVLDKYGLVERDENGMIVKVAGVEASWDKDQAYWAFYIGGEYAAHGVDDEMIADGNEYEFVYTKG